MTPWRARGGKEWQGVNTETGILKYPMGDTRGGERVGKGLTQRQGVLNDPPEGTRGERVARGQHRDRSTQIPPGGHKREGKSGQGVNTEAGSTQ